MSTWFPFQIGIGFWFWGMWFLWHSDWVAVESKDLCANMAEAAAIMDATGSRFSSLELIGRGSFGDVYKGSVLVFIGAVFIFLCSELHLTLRRVLKYLGFALLACYHTIWIAIYLIVKIIQSFIRIVKEDQIIILRKNENVNTFKHIDHTNIWQYQQKSICGIFYKAMRERLQNMRKST